MWLVTGHPYNTVQILETVCMAVPLLRDPCFLPFHKTYLKDYAIIVIFVMLDRRCIGFWSPCTADTYFPKIRLSTELKYAMFYSPFRVQTLLWDVPSEKERYLLPEIWRKFIPPESPAALSKQNDVAMDVLLDWAAKIGFPPTHSCLSGKTVAFHDTVGSSSCLDRGELTQRSRSATESDYRSIPCPLLKRNGPSQDLPESYYSPTLSSVFDRQRG